MQPASVAIELAPNLVPPRNHSLVSRACSTRAPASQPALAHCSSSVLSAKGKECLAFLVAHEHPSDGGQQAGGRLHWRFVPDSPCTQAMVLGVEPLSSSSPHSSKELGSEKGWDTDAQKGGKVGAWSSKPSFVRGPIPAMVQSGQVSFHASVSAPEALQTPQRCWSSPKS